MARKMALLADRFNTLWFENDCVHMLNRRKYPFSVEYVTCRDLESVAVAIENMTIQGAPPLAYAAGLGLAMHARAHQAIIARFGRFPYRNDALGRHSTTEETLFMREGGYASIVKDLRAAATK